MFVVGHPYCHSHVFLLHIYASLQAYGFHRVYRRLLEANKRLVDSPKDRRLIQDNIKEAMRFPTKIVDVLEESHTIAFLQKYAKELTTGIEAKAPSFFITAAKILVTKTPIARIFDIIDDWRGAHRRKKQGKSENGSSARGGTSSSLAPPSSLPASNAEHKKQAPS